MNDIHNNTFFKILKIYILKIKYKMFGWINVFLGRHKNELSVWFVLIKLNLPHEYFIDVFIKINAYYYN